MQVSKWGNSLAVRLPAKLVRELGLKEGDQIEVVARDGRLEIEKKPDIKELLKRLRKYRGRLPKGYKFKRSDAYDDY